MEDYEGWGQAPVNQPPAPRRRVGRWLLIGGLALSFMLALGVGVLLGSSTSASQAAALTTGSSNSSPQSLTFAQGPTSNTQPFAGRQGAAGQCESLTVSSVSGNTIVAKTASGSTITVHTTASTRYTQAGKTVAASAIKAGSRISVMGTHNSDGSITATSIDIVG